MSSTTYNNFTDKQKAEQRRKIADAFDALAEAFEPLEEIVTEGYKRAAEANRKTADELDPPLPEWDDGDLVRDHNGWLWEYMLGVWFCCGMRRETEALTRNYGPLTRVSTYDPAKQRVVDSEQQKVVISLDGIDRTELDKWGEENKSNYLPTTAEKVAFRVSAAAREQLKKVEE